MTCQNLRNVGRLSALVAPTLVSLFLLSGCDLQDPEYSSDVRYTLRTEPMVVSSLETSPARLDKPGQLSLILQTIEGSDRKKLVNPNELNAQQKGELDAALGKLFGTPQHPIVSAASMSGL